MAKSKDTNLEALTQRILRKKSNDKGGGSKKYGRNRAKCALYRTNRSHKNKVAKLKRHLARHPNDGCARASYQLHR